MSLFSSPLSSHKNNSTVPLLLDMKVASNPQTLPFHQSYHRERKKPKIAHGKANRKRLSTDTSRCSSTSSSTWSGFKNASHKDKRLSRGSTFRNVLGSLYEWEPDVMKKEARLDHEPYSPSTLHQEEYEHANIDDEHVCAMSIKDEITMMDQLTTVLNHETRPKTNHTQHSQHAADVPPHQQINDQPETPQLRSVSHSLGFYSSSHIEDDSRRSNQRIYNTDKRHMTLTFDLRSTVFSSPEKIGPENGENASGDEETTNSTDLRHIGSDSLRDFPHEFALYSKESAVEQNQDKEQSQHEETLDLPPVSTFAEDAVPGQATTNTAEIINSHSLVVRNNHSSTPIQTDHEHVSSVSQPSTLFHTPMTNVNDVYLPQHPSWEEEDPSSSLENDIIGEVLREQYEIQHILHRSEQSIVFQCLDTINAERVCIKFIPCLSSSKPIKNHEVEALKKLRNCPHVPTIHRVFLFGEFICIVMDLLAPFTLQTLISRNNAAEVLSMDMIKSFASQLLFILRFLKKRGIAHGNICPANIIVTMEKATYKLWLVGFSRCQVSRSSRLYETSQSPSFCTAKFSSKEIYPHAPPEILLDLPSTHISTAVNVWQVGCTLLSAFFQVPSYFGASSNAPFEILKEVVHKTQPHIPQSMLRACRRSFVVKHPDDPKRLVLAIRTTIPTSPDKPRKEDFITIESDEDDYSTVVDENKSEMLVATPKRSISGTLSPQESGDEQRKAKILLGTKESNPLRQEILLRSVEGRQLDYTTFFRLIQNLLQFDPKQRITPSKGLKHEFLMGNEQ